MKNRPSKASATNEAPHPGDSAWPLLYGRAACIPLAFATALAVLALTLLRGQNLIVRACLGAALALVVWTGYWILAQSKSGRALSVGIRLHKHHWVQAAAQITVYLYWGWFVPGVYSFAPLILAQLLFAYGVEALLTWSRRDRYLIGFGPFPVVLSINLFLWFRPEWFHWQFVMVAVGYLCKELIRWERDGRRVHIFNPSSFPLALVALVLILTGSSDITFGGFIANTQHDPPYIYLVIFLAALPGQLLFGVARMTLAAVVSMYAFSLVFFAITGTYFFYDAHIPVPVFLGMHLLFTDPSTSPRTGLGRLGFGVLYAAGTVGFYLLLTGNGIPTFYDKLLPVPLMNLTVRGIDQICRSDTWSKWDPSAVGRSLSASVHHVAWAGLWTAVFLTMSAVQGVGDRHPGQYLPFWIEQCDAGSTRACSYADFLTLTYCNNGSGWACNEVGIQRAQSREQSQRAFTRGCALGFQPACLNAARGPAAQVARSAPTLRDLPIVLRGTKPPLEGATPERLAALACEQRWQDACGSTSVAR